MRQDGLPGLVDFLEVQQAVLQTDRKMHCDGPSDDELPQAKPYHLDRLFIQRFALEQYLVKYTGVIVLIQEAG